MKQDPAAGGRQEWFSAAELAERALPGLPATKRGVQAVAGRLGWEVARCNVRGPLVRPRRGRGGGVEYHVSLLPEAARAALAIKAVETVERPDRESAWMRWERLPNGHKAEALRRLAIIEQVEHLTIHGMRKGAAVAEVAKRAEGVSCSALYEWMARVAGIPPQDRPVYLVPEYQGRTATAECHPEAWEFYKANFLRQSRPSHSACYGELGRVAAKNGWAIPSAKTLQRRLEAEIPTPVQTLLRYGDQALAHAYPHLERDRSTIAPMQIGNLDGHTWDVNVIWEDGTVGRPLSLAVQDIASGKVLSIRFGMTLNHHLVRLALGDAFRDHGVFDTLIMDNGRENAAKAISGGQTRNRWKATEEEADGLLKLLGVKAVFATPYWGQAKPVERAFRDFAHGLAKIAAFEGAYTGHNTVSKRENHGSRAIPIAEFEAIVRREIAAAHNARRGRTGSGMRGRSFDEVFAEGAARRPARRVTPEQLRLCLLASKPVRMDPRDHAVRVEGHRYWSPELGALKAQQVVVRYDPEQLDRPAYVYSLDGRFLAEAACLERGSFNSVSQAQAQRRNVRDYKRGVRLQAAALRRMDAAEVEAAIAEASPAPAEPMPTDETVVRPDFGAPRSAEQLGQGRKASKDFNENWQRGVNGLLGTG